MKMNVIPTEEFIEKLEYATTWFHELRHGEFVIESNGLGSVRYRTGNFTDWLHQQFKDRRHRDYIPMWGELRLLLEAYPNIEKLEFVGVCPEYIRDMGDTLTTLCELFREVEANRGPVKAHRGTHLDRNVPPPKVEFAQ